MSMLAEIGSWIASNESLLSGVAAMIVVAGVLFSPIGAGLRRYSRRRRSGAARDGDAASIASEPGTRRLSFKDLTAPGPSPISFADSGGVKIAYTERGRGPHTIVLAPGLFSHLHLTANLPATRGTLEALAGFARVVTFDKRGQGLSDPTLNVPDLDERTRDIEAVMDAAGIDRAVLMGFSEGGPMCLNFAHANPDRVQGLVLWGSTARWLQSEDFPIGIHRRTLEKLSESWGTGVLRDTFFPSIGRDQIDDDTYRSCERLIGNRNTLRQLVAMMIETDVRALLPAITVPALIVHFTGDLAVPLRMGRALAEGLPDAEFLEVNAVDHADLSHSPEAVARVRSFCERVAAPA